MKRKISVLLLLLCCAHFMLGFGFTQVSKVEKAIDAVGLVTIESRDEIEAAEKMYAELSPKKQKRVDNYDTLLLARVELDRLDGLIVTAQRALDAVQEPITRDSGDVVIAANNAYRAAREASVHSCVTGYDRLYMAIDTYASIMITDADKLMKQRKYTEAYLLYASVLENFPGCDYGGDAYDGCRNAIIGNADSLYNGGKLEDALDALTEVDEYYGVSENSTALREKIYKRLEQQRPRNGQSFKNTAGWGYNEFAVSAGNKDAYIKLENVNDPSKYVLFYARAGEESTVKLKDGSYIAKYATGEYWFSMDSLFGCSTTYTQAEDVLEFTTTREGNSIYYTTIQITLYEVVGGDLETSEIAPNAF